MEENNKKKELSAAVIMYVLMILYFAHSVLRNSFGLSAGSFSFNLISFIFDIPYVLFLVASVILLIITLSNKKQSAIGISSFPIMSIILLLLGSIQELREFKDNATGVNGSFLDYLMINIVNIVVSLISFALLTVAVVCLLRYYTRESHSSGVTARIIIAAIIIRQLYLNGSTVYALLSFHIDSSLILINAVISYILDIGVFITILIQLLIKKSELQLQQTVPSL